MYIHCFFFPQKRKTVQKMEKKKNKKFFYSFFYFFFLFLFFLPCVINIQATKEKKKRKKGGIYNLVTKPKSGAYIYRYVSFNTISLVPLYLNGTLVWRSPVRTHNKTTIYIITLIFFFGEHIKFIYTYRFGTVMK